MHTTASRFAPLVWIYLTVSAYSALADAVEARGDACSLFTAAQVGTALAVKKGSTCMQIRVGGFPIDKAKEVEKALALQFVSKL